MPNACRGEIWRVDLNPVIGHEQGEVRPALIVSVDKLNHGPSEMIVVVPVTSKVRNIPIHVPIAPPEAGLTMASEIKCDQVRAISSRRLLQRLGAVAPATLAEVEDRLRIVLGL